MSELLKTDDERKTIEFEHAGYSWRLRELTQNECWSLVALVDNEAEVDNLWPSDDLVSELAGRNLQFFDAGDHPDFPEAIFHDVGALQENEMVCQWAEWKVE